MLEIPSLLLWLRRRPPPLLPLLRPLSRRCCFLKCDVSLLAALKHTPQPRANLKLTSLSLGRSIDCKPVKETRNSHPSFHVTSLSCR
jgi:hypothetical protein